MARVNVVGVCYAVLLGFAAGCTRAPLPAVPSSFGQTASLLTSRDQTDLLYVSSSDRVYAYAYPRDKRVQTLTGFLTPSGLCSDSAGDVFVTNFGGQSIAEYAHGGSSPIAELQDRYEQPNDCAVDPATGNLAVANIDGSVAIYTQAKGKPKMYHDRQLPYMLYLTYDGQGDLFVDGEDASFEDFQLAELSPGSKGFKTIALDQTPAFPGGIQWDGEYLAVADQGSPRIFRYAISGSGGTTAGVVTLDRATDIGEFWLTGSSIVADDMGKQDVGIWNYPDGGNPTKVIKGFRDPLGVTLSPAARR